MSIHEIRSADRTAFNMRYMLAEAAAKVVTAKLNLAIARLTSSSWHLHQEQMAVNRASCSLQLLEEVYCDYVAKGFPPVTNFRSRDSSNEYVELSSSLEKRLKA